MADLKQRILLDGIEDIKAGFAAISKAGQAAFNAINRIKFSPERFAAANAAAKTLNKSFRELGNNANIVGNNIRSSTKTISLLSGTVVGLAAAFLKLTSDAANAADAIDEAAQAAGLSTKEFENLQGSIKQSGIDSEGFSTILGRFNRSVDQAKERTNQFAEKQRDLASEFSSGRINSVEYSQRLTDLNKTVDKATDGYSRLGVSVLGADGQTRKLTDVLDDVANSFADMPDGVDKSAIAIDIFGRAGQRMIPFLNQGATGIRRLNEETERLSPAMTGLQLSIGRGLADSLDRLTLAASNAKNQFFLLFAPTLTTLADALTEAIVANRAALLELGNLILQTIKPTIQDLINVLRGGEPVQGGFISRVTEGLRIMQQAVVLLVGAFNGLVAVADVLAAAINGIFGTEFSGKAIVIAGLITQLIGGFTLLSSVIGLVGSGLVIIVNTFSLLIALFGGWPVAIAAVVASLVALFVQLGGIDAIKEKFAALVAYIETTWVGRFIAAIGRVISKIGELLSSLSKVGSGKISVGGAGTPTGFAEGGHVSGAGTSTSDSIIARLSDGEYVIKAAAVRKFGASFFDALNSLRLPGFAGGGMVRASVPVGSGLTRTLNLTLDGQSFDGLKAPEDTAKNLERFARNRRLTRAGRAPGWKG